jgi:hypothetical protein
MGMKGIILVGGAGTRQALELEVKVYNINKGRNPAIEERRPALGANATSRLEASVKQTA